MLKWGASSCFYTMSSVENKVNTEHTVSDCVLINAVAGGYTCTHW